MRRVELYAVVVSTLTAILSSSLALVGEARVDAYLSLAILSHFVAAAVTGVDAEVRGASLRILNALLVTLFAVVVALRVLQILSPQWLHTGAFPWG